MSRSSGSLRLLLDRGIVTPQQVEQCRSVCGEQAGEDTLIDELLAQGLVEFGELVAAGVVAPPPSAGTLQGPAPIQPVAPAAAASIADAAAPPHPPDDAPVRIGRFLLREEIGRGGMGSVYRAHDPALGRDVAVKLLRETGVFTSPQVTRRFHLEARACARLKHAGLVPVYEAGEDSGRLYLVMELVEGASLAHHLRPVATDPPIPLEPTRAATLVCEAAEAIAHCHSHGVIHRDLKPSNVFVDREGRARVGDFGLALDLDAEAGSRITASGSLLGTPAYMAPEQADGHNAEVGPHTDIYGLGAILYDLLTGQPPHCGDNIRDLLNRVVNHDVTPPSRIRPGIPPDLERICLQCLSKEPASRYRSAADLARDLRHLLAGRSVEARAPSLPGRFGRWIRRKREVVRAVLLVLGITGTIVAAAWWKLGARAADEQAFLRSHTVHIERTLAEWRRSGSEESIREFARLRERLDSRLTHHPGSYAACALRGYLAVILGQWESADADLSRALAGAPDDPSLLYRRGLARFGLFLDGLFQAQVSWQAAKTVIHPTSGWGDQPSHADLAGYQPDLLRLRESAESDLLRARELIEAGVISELPRGAESCGLGILAYARGDYAEADALLTRGLESDRNQEYAWTVLIAVREATGGNTESGEETLLRTLADALQTNPHMASWWLTRARVRGRAASRLREGETPAEFDAQWEQASSDLDRAIALCRDNPAIESAAFQLRMLHAEQVALDRGEATREIAVAEALAHRIFAKHPPQRNDQAILARLDMVRMLAARGDLESALAHGRRSLQACEEILAAHPHSLEVRETLVHVLMALANRLPFQTQEAVDILERAATQLEILATRAPGWRIPFLLTRIETLLGQVQLLVERGESTSGIEVRIRQGADEILAHGGAPELLILPLLTLRSTALAKRENLKEGEILGFRNEVRSLLEQASGYSPRDAADRESLATILVNLAGTLNTAGEPTSETYRLALHHAETALVRRPASVAALAAAGSAWVGLGSAASPDGADAGASFVRALHSFARSVSLRPNSIMGWGGLSHAWHGLAMLAHARGMDSRISFLWASFAAERARELSPQHPLPAKALARSLEGLYLSERDLGANGTAHLMRALECMDPILARNPHDAEARYLRGRIHYRRVLAPGSDSSTQRRFLRAAEDDFRLAASDLPCLWVAWAMLGRVLETRMDSAGAEEAYARALEAGGTTHGTLLEDIDRVRRARAAQRGWPNWLRSLWEGERAVRSGDYPHAAETFHRGFQEMRAAGFRVGEGGEEIPPGAVGVVRIAHYSYACCLALAGGADDSGGDRTIDGAFTHLREAIRLGMGDRGAAERDPDLQGLREDPRWSELPWDRKR